MEETDLQLVQRAQKDDQDAFQELMERYQRRIYSLCYGMLRREDEAMDLVQETFIKAYRNLHRFEGNAAFYTWIYRIARNACIDHIRKSKRVQAVEYDDTYQGDSPEDGEAILPSRLGVSPAKVAGRRELAEQIEQALGVLSENHRQTILLREVEGLSYQEIADVTEVSIGTVMSRLHHARKKMQAALQDYVGNSMLVEDR